MMESENDGGLIWIVLVVVLNLVAPDQALAALDKVVRRG
jgi:hypothetical protein